MTWWKLAIVLTMLPSFVQAQAMCGEYKTVKKSLKGTYNEERTQMGLASNGAVIEVLSSHDGSFTIILVRPNGLACVMAAGEAWENFPLPPQGEKS